MQNGPIEGLDAVIDRLQKAIALGGLMFGQHPARQEGDDGQRDNEGRPDRTEDRHGQGPRIGSCAPWKGHERQEGQHQAGGAADNGEGNLARAIDSRGGAIFTLAQPPGNVLGDHDRIVDQKTKGQNEPGNGELVQVKAEQLQHHHPDQQGQGD